MASMTLEEALESAVRFQQAGQSQEAEKLYRQILAQRPDCADAEHLLGVLCAQSGRFAEGVQLIRRAIARHPEIASFQANLGHILFRENDFEGAAEAYQKAAELKPADLELRLQLGNALFSLRRVDEAEKVFRDILAIRNYLPEAWANLGSVMIEKRKFDQTVEHARRALALRPQFAEALVVLGTGLTSLGQIEEAIEQFNKAIAIKPDFAEAHNNLALSLIRRRRFSEAAVALDRTVQLRPDWATGWSNRAKLLRHQGKPAEAEIAARRAIASQPDFALAQVNLAGALFDLKRIDEAIPIARRSVELTPDRPETHNILANVLKEAGAVTEAAAEFDRAAELAPEDPVDLSNKIYLLEFDPRCDAKGLLAEQRKWNARFGEPLKKLIRPFGNDRSADRVLRVGYVSPYFFAHAESFFVVPLLEHHDREQFEIHCYSDAIRCDEVTDRLKQSSHAWHETSRLNDQELAEQIRGDGIDILVDLTMHMAFNRALVFAHKPAPVQVCWLAYPGGMGLDTIDYRISDPWIDPPGEDESCYRERTIRLASTWVCYDPLSDVAAVGPREAGPIRFGSMNNPCKLGEPTLRLWAKTLLGVDDSRLIVQAISQLHRGRILGVMREEGVAAEQIEFLDRSGREEYLRRYERIDIGLDPLPYNGITTTCDALWMGVPVMTLAGKTAAGRAGRSILENVGMGELAARDEQQFLQIATQLAGDTAKLAELRANLRGRMKASPIMDGKSFAREMESSYRVMYQRHINEK